MFRYIIYLYIYSLNRLWECFYIINKRARLQIRSIYIYIICFFAYLHVYICEYIPSLLKILSFLQCYVRFTIMFGQCMVMFCWCRLNWDFFFGL